MELLERILSPEIITIVVVQLIGLATIYLTNRFNLKKSGFTE